MEQQTFPGSAICLHLQAISAILVTCLKPEKDPEVKLTIFTILSTNIVGRKDLLSGTPDAGSFLIKLVKGTYSYLKTFLNFGMGIPNK
jgi:hypothetical protein